MRLFHFTSAQHGLSAIRDQRYKLSTYDNLNDPFELFAADLANPKIRNAFMLFKDKVARSTALLCCSKSWNSTLLWSHYADRHRGVALELEVDDARVNHIVYKKQRSPITPEAMVANMNCEDGSGIGAQMQETKALDWAYEDEARVIYDISHLRRPANGLYFMPFDCNVSLRGVILGPLCTCRIEDVADCLPTNVHLTVSKARIAFRSFRVVKDLSFKSRRLVGDA